MLTALFSSLGLPVKASARSSPMRDLCRLVTSTSVFLSLILSFLSGCARDTEKDTRISSVVPVFPGVSSFGPLYPRIHASLSATPPDVATAVGDVKSWAEQTLDSFREGSCAHTLVVFDSEFTRIFGKSTLGVTLPWMQIYIRDGEREEDPFLWKDPSLFVSTVLHEHVHAIQRARQARNILGTAGAPSCDAALGALSARKLIFTSGFDSLRASSYLADTVAESERALLYRWISPILRARDEVEASVYTVRWMRDHRDELNELTIGGANNWVYGVQYLNQLKTLSHGTCFSPDSGTFEEERRIFEEDIPRFISELGSTEVNMKVFLAGKNIPALKLSVSELESHAAPSGREGSKCQTGSTGETHRFYFPTDGELKSLARAIAAP